MVAKRPSLLGLHHLLYLMSLVPASSLINLLAECARAFGPFHLHLPLLGIASGLLSHFLQVLLKSLFLRPVAVLPDTK